MEEGHSKHYFYGFPTLPNGNDQTWSAAKEQLENEGFFILKDVFEPSLINTAIEKLKEVYGLQISEIGGLENLRAIKEENTVRVPFLYDDFFVQFFAHPLIMEVLRAVYCKQFILLTQAGLINEPNKRHVGAYWHKDLPYQHYASKQPICVNALVALTEFTEDNGGTCFVKGSHKMVNIPDDDFMDNNFVQISAPRGALIVFNSLLLHRMGQNSSDKPRFAINHMFGTPIFKQHVNFHHMSNGKYKDDPLLSKLLDYPYRLPDSVASYRQNKLKALSKND